MKGRIRKELLQKKAPAWFIRTNGSLISAAYHEESGAKPRFLIPDNHIFTGKKMY